MHVVAFRARKVLAKAFTLADTLQHTSAESTPGQITECRQPGLSMCALLGADRFGNVSGFGILDTFGPEWELFYPDKVNPTLEDLQCPDLFRALKSSCFQRLGLVVQKCPPLRESASWDG